MQNLFDLLETRYTTPARCAAALNVTRQAYHQARARRRLSDRAAILAAALLDMEPGAALLLNATANDPALPVQNPTPNPAPALNIIDPDNTNYAHCDGIKKGGKSAPLEKLHVITSEAQKTAIDLIRWVFAVANIRADSPRFAYYVSRWRVPEKITAAKQADTFDQLTANCPPIDPGWIRLVPPALDAYRDFIKPTGRPPEIKAASSGKPPARSNRKRLVA